MSLVVRAVTRDLSLELEVFLGGMQLDVVPCIGVLLVTNLLKFDLQALIIQLILLWVLTEHAPIPLEVRVRIHSLYISVLELF